MILKFYLPFLIIIILIFLKKKRQVLYNELFWLFFWWTLVIGVYFSGKVDWGQYRVSFQTLLYTLSCIGVFLLFVYVGEHSKIKMKKALDLESYSRITNRTRIYATIGIIGTLIFVADYLRLNGLLAQKSNYAISIVGSIGMVFSPILLVLGLYRVSSSLRNGLRISWSGLLYLIIFNIPSLLNSGRETLVCTMIGLLAVVAASFSTKEGKNEIQRERFKIRLDKRKTLIGLGVIIVMVIAVSLIRNTTANRFQQTAVSVFLNSHNVSSQTISEAESLGDYSTIYYHLLSYFGHQLPFVQFLLAEYKGPFMFGLFELNIISRRLPEILNLNYQAAYDSIRSLSGMRFNGSWPTIIGSFIIDFSPIGAIIGCMICGLVIGRARKKYLFYQDDKYTVLKGLLCFSMTSTIQLGPFYNVAIYGAFIWWLIIFRAKNETL